MPVIEILAYAPKDMKKFIDFCIDGKPDGQGDYDTDAQGRKIVGVLRWLHGRGVPEAHFFHSDEGDAVQLFVAMIERKESYDVPWMRRIAGFEEMVISDGLIGRTNQFVNIGDLFSAVKSDPNLDQRFAQGKIDVERILGRIQGSERLLSGGKQGLLAALTGNLGANPQEVFAEVETKLGIAL
jgi:hypothetical protein